MNVTLCLSVNSSFDSSAVDGSLGFLANSCLAFSEVTKGKQWQHCTFLVAELGFRCGNLPSAERSLSSQGLQVTIELRSALCGEAGLDLVILLPLSPEC